MTIFYKYLSTKGAILSLRNRTMRLSRPSVLNDPFDVYVHDLFNLEISDVIYDTKSLVELLKATPKLFAKVCGIEETQATATSKLIQGISEEQQNDLIGKLNALPMEEISPELKRLRGEMELQRKDAIALFKDSGIFCATKNHSNLLMWAHYAEQHYGCVLGFEADAAKDSVWALLEPVVYSDIRPDFYSTIQKSIFQGEGVTLEDIQKTIKRLIYTKSTHWAYEEELRLYDPINIPQEKDAVYYSFYPNELKEVYLGCRTTEETQTTIIAAAKAHNPEVKIFRAKLVDHSFALDFETL